MDIFAVYATDENKEVDGVVVYLNDNAEDPKRPWMKVARMNNIEYQKAISSSFEKLQAAKKAERLSDAEMEIRSKNAMIQVMADTILKDFGNLEFQGQPLVPSPESKLQLLRVKDFRELVATKASDIDLYRAEYVAAAAGN